MPLFTPSELETLTGLSVANQRAWRHSGFLRDRGEQTAGGHWRFRPGDVLFVATARAVADMGLTLGVATVVADHVLRDVAAAVRGEDGARPDHPFVLIWKAVDTARDAPGVLTTDDDGFSFIALADLARVPAFTRSGGFVLIVADIARKIPPEVAALFAPQEKGGAADA